ncbi:MAG: phosphotransferase [Salinibacterium sp.]|nr:phosphotransferase [Salinibacterium sp.]
MPGPLLSEVQTPASLESFYHWAKSHLWEDRRDRVEAARFVDGCRRFYRDKTLDRLTRYFESRDRRDAAAVVNGRSLPPVFDLLESLDWQWICAGNPVRFHGDLHTDNVVVTGRDGAEAYRLIDWRQDFAGRTDVGDLYYDLAKLHHYFALSPRVVEQQRFDCRVDGKTAQHRHDDLPGLGDCLASLERFVECEGWDLRKVETLSALCFLNMGALHPGAAGDLFFHHGWSSLATIVGPKKSALRLHRPVVCELDHEPITIR